MNSENSRSKKLLDKVYNQLDSIDLTKLSMREMSDFLEVVQKGRFLESIGQMPQYGFGGLCSYPSNGPGKPEDIGTAKHGDKQE